jgi:hypothetical protein
MGSAGPAPAGVPASPFPLVSDGAPRSRSVRSRSRTPTWVRQGPTHRTDATRDHSASNAVFPRRVRAACRRPGRGHDLGDEQSSTLKSPSRWLTTPVPLSWRCPRRPPRRVSTSQRPLATTSDRRRFAPRSARAFGVFRSGFSAPASFIASSPPTNSARDRANAGSAAPSGARGRGERGEKSQASRAQSRNSRPFPASSISPGCRACCRKGKRRRRIGRSTR